MKSDSLLQLIAQAIYDKKGSNIVAIDIKEVSSVTDYIVIAEGNVDRHVKAIATEVESVLKDLGERPLRVEGRQNGDWIVLDYGHTMVHLFMPELREKYQLERLWSQGKLLELKIEVADTVYD